MKNGSNGDKKGRNTWLSRVDLERAAEEDAAERPETTVETARRASEEHGGPPDMPVPRFATISLNIDVPEMVRLYLSGNRHDAMSDRFMKFSDNCETYLLRAMQSMLWSSIDEFTDEGDPRLRPILDLVELLNSIESATLISREKSA